MAKTLKLYFISKKRISLSGKEKITYIMHFTETESGIQKVSSCFRLTQPIYLLKDSTNTCPIPTPVWVQCWPQLPVQPIELSLALCSSNALSTSRCIFECQKPKNQSRRGGKIILAQRIKKEKNSVSVSTHEQKTETEKDVSGQLHPGNYDETIPQKSQHTKYCKWHRQLKTNLMNDNYLYHIWYHTN